MGPYVELPLCELNQCKMQQYQNGCSQTQEQAREVESRAQIKA